MTGEEFAAIRRELGYTKKQFGRILGMQGKAKTIFQKISAIEDGKDFIGPKTERIVRAMMQPISGVKQ